MTVHGWDYRRYVVGKLEIDERQEFEYTTKKIHENFSNFSAWHYRSILLPKAFKDGEYAEQIQKDLELVRNAIFTEPNDQSAWLYQRWMLKSHEAPQKAIHKELAAVQELYEMEPDSKWTILAMIFMLLSLESSLDSADRIRSLTAKLKTIDPYRVGYYNHLESLASSQNY